MYISAAAHGVRAASGSPLGASPMAGLSGGALGGGVDYNIT